VGVAVDHLDPQVYASDTDDEREVLAALDNLIGGERGVRIVGHNVAGFDIPFLRVRALRHRLPRLAAAFGRWTGKPWDARCVDTMALWPSTGRGQTFVKLQHIRRALGLPVQVGIDGSEVAAAWYDGRRDEVIRHCRLDVADVREVYGLMRDLL
jgi:DNA polymerase elongation subunit (family B)